MFKLLLALLFCLNLYHISATTDAPDDGLTVTEDFDTDIETTEASVDDIGIDIDIDTTEVSIDDDDDEDDDETTDVPDSSDNDSDTDASVDESDDSESNVTDSPDSNNSESDSDSDGESSTETESNTGGVSSENTDDSTSTDTDTDTDTSDETSDVSNDGDDNSNDSNDPSEDGYNCEGLAENDCRIAVDDDGDHECSYNQETSDCYSITRREGQYGNGNFDDGFVSAQANAANTATQLEAVIGIMGGVIAALLIVVICGGCYVYKQMQKVDTLKVMDIEDAMDMSLNDGPMYGNGQTMHIDEDGVELIGDQGRR